MDNYGNSIANTSYYLISRLDYRLDLKIVGATLYMMIHFLLMTIFFLVARTKNHRPIIL